MCDAFDILAQFESVNFIGLNQILKYFSIFFDFFPIFTILHRKF